MFTGSPPDVRGDRVRLPFYAHAVQAAIGRGTPVYPVAVHRDARFHRLVPLQPVHERPYSTAPASHAGDVDIARGEPVPRP